MKSLREFLTENYQAKVILHFLNDSAAFMWNCEMKGQISDGKYENGRPFNHWEWVTNTEDIVDGNEYYERIRPRTKKYNLKEWINPIKDFLKTGKYSWEVRLYFYGKIGKIIKYSDKTAEDYGYLAELYGEAQLANKKFNEIEIKSYWQRHIDKIKNDFSEEVYEKFCNLEYTEKEFLNDLKSMEKTINTYK